MRSYIQFVTTPTSDTPGTLLLLHFDSKRYLIGHIAEGTQRACIQRGTGLRKVSDILLTGRTEWNNTGGLLGLILTTADSKESAGEAIAQRNAQKLKNQAQNGDDEASGSQPKSKVENDMYSHLNLYGAPNLEHTIATARRFVFRKGLPLRTTEYSASDSKSSDSNAPTWSDENIRVYAIPLLPRQVSTKAGRHGEAQPRKRSHDEANGEQAHSSGSKLYQVPNHKEMRRAIVSDMFDSTWRLDTLIQTPLSEVNLPATLFTKNPTTKALEEYKGPLPGGDEEIPDIMVFTRKPWPSAMIKELPPTEPALEAISYIIRNLPQRGRFDVKKAAELGIFGHDRANLAKGHNIQNAKGETITPDMVLEPGKQGAGVVIADLPTVDYVEAFIQRTEWNNTDIMDGVEAFVWLLGPGVAASPLLQQFQRDRPDMLHIFSAADCSPDILALESAAVAAVRHNLVDSNIFPIPLQTEKDDGTSKSQSMILAERGKILMLEPKVEIRDEELVKPLDVTSVATELSPEVLPSRQEHLFPTAQEEAEFEEWSKTIPSNDAEIITLGTGSSLPSKYRNVSGNLVRVPGCGSYLFDCGENTLGTLKRMYSPDELKEVFRDLKMIWISHLHADHHLGTTSIIKAWYQAVHNGIPSTVPIEEAASATDTSGPRLAIVSDAPMLHWLSEYSSVEDFGYSRLLPLASQPIADDAEIPAYGSTLRIAASASKLASDSVAMLTHDLPSAPPPADPSRFLRALNLKTLSTVAVTHCRGAQAIAVTFNSGLKVSYSGDCRPSYTRFARIGARSHVLLHEATFEDELRGDALAKKHCTVGEALGVAAAMRAAACVLTHFSQRYQKVPVLRAAAEGGLPDDEGAPVPALHERIVTVVAFDYMRVRVRDLPRLENLQPLLGRLYAELKSRERPAEEEGKAETHEVQDVVPPVSKRQKKRQARQQEEAYRKRVEAEAAGTA